MKAPSSCQGLESQIIYICSSQKIIAYSQQICIYGRSRQLHSFRVSSHNTLIDLNTSPSNLLECLLHIEGQVSLAVEQGCSLTKDRLDSRKNFHTLTNLTQESGTPTSIEQDSESSVPDLANLLTLQFPEILLCPEILKRLDYEALRKKFETTATYPNKPGVIHNA